MSLIANGVTAIQLFTVNNTKKMLCKKLRFDYSVNNVVISNRYISKMITQIGEKEALFDFYTDILTYDEGDSDTYESREIYIKKVKRYFTEVPKATTADQFIRAVYCA